MDLKSSLWCLALYLLLLMNENQIQAELTTEHKREGMPHNHMDHSIAAFFTPNDLKIGLKKPLLFHTSTTSPHFIPKDYADSIPFSSSKLVFLLDFFGFRQGTSQAIAMEETLTQCETEPIKGETKFCATSLESMLDFVHKSFGPTTKFKVLSTQKLPKSTNHNILQNYTVVDEPKQVSSSKMVACHTMPYPYLIYYCHFQESETQVFQASLMGDKGSQMEVIVVCHMDTSQWSPNHVSFKVIGTKPGSSPVCHFFPEAHLVWVPLLDSQGLKEVV